MRLFTVRDEAGTDMTIDLDAVTIVFIPSEFRAQQIKAKVVMGSMNLDMQSDTARKILDAWKLGDKNSFMTKNSQ